MAYKASLINQNRLKILQTSNRREVTTIEIGFSAFIAIQKFTLHILQKTDENEDSSARSNMHLSVDKNARFICETNIFVES